MLAWLMGAAGFTAFGATTVKLGEVRQIRGPADVDLDGEFVYAINFSTDDPVRTVRGVAFLPDNKPIPGATLVGPQQVTPWQTKPEFGTTADANQLEEILQDIRWANTGSSERLRATLVVRAGDEYKLQVFISANGNEDRHWDIRVNGREAVDEITSLGVSPGQSYAQNRATMYSYQFTATTASVVVEMGQLFGANDGGDRNPIWQALTLERVTIPPTPDDVVASAARFFANQTTPITRFSAVDRRFEATHQFALVGGAGSGDNAKFKLIGPDLVSDGFDFGTVPVGTPFSIRVRATDAANANRFLDKVFLLTLVAPSSPTDLTLDAKSIDSGARPPALVAQVTVADPDEFDRHLVALVAGPGDRDNADLTVSGGDLRLARRPVAESTELRFRLRATDLAGLSREASFILPLVSASVRINEVLASEITGVGSASGLPEEWLELFNPATHYVDLSGWHLTDDREDLSGWTFPARVLAPGAFLVVLADNSATPPDGSTNLHASFSLSAGGEWIGLVRPDGATLVTNLSFPAQYPGVAYGVGADGKVGHLPVPTPGAANGAIAEGGENLVSFSRTRGFYTNAFELTLEAAIPGSVIRYTIDGSVPTPTSGTVYTGPINVGPNTTGATRGTRIVRAVAVHPRAAYSRVGTHTYLFINGVAGPAVDGVVSQTRLVTSITRHATYGPLLDDAFLALPALALTMSGGPATTERVASVELFDPEGREAGFQVDCGIAATGTTSLSSPKLSMAARFRTEYGNSKLRYPVFARGSMVGGRPANEFNELRLRSHSHDTFFWLGTRENPPVPYGSPSVNRSGDAQLARNPWIDEMQIAMGQPGKRGRQVHMYLNGAYHGIYHIHEHPDEDYMAGYYGGDRTDYHFTGGATAGSQHSNGESWTKIWASVKSSLGSYPQAKRWIDVTNLCDYMVLSFYAGNDWDWSAQHNWAAAGPRLADQGGWKFFQQDSDISLQDIVADCTDQTVPDGIFTSLMRFPDFKVLFRDRIVKHLTGEGMLTPARAGALYNARMNEISTAIVAETARWQPSSSIAALPWDRDQEWSNEWRYLRDTFFPQRTARVLQQFRARGWWVLVPPTPSQPEGRVPEGQRITFSAPSGTVYFTTDGSDPRLPGGAVNPTARSVGIGKTETTLIAPGAVWRFLEDGSDPGAGWNGVGFDDLKWRSGPAEIGYGDGNEVTTSGFVDADPATDGVQKNITTYFRREFDVKDILAVTELKLRLLRDDGAVVYLNGKEIWRVNLPEGPVTRETRAVAGIGGADETTFIEQTIGAGQLVLRSTGNVLAVEMHQQSPDSSDISFDFELISSGSGALAGSILVVDGPTVVRARVFSGTDWSGLTDLFYLPAGIQPASANNLVISEIQYRPMDEPDAEFLEFLNTSTAAVDLSGVVITNGVWFPFPRATVLGAGERLVVVKDIAAFDARYLSTGSPYLRAGLRRFGPWAGSLSNDGETIDVLDAGGGLLLRCAFGTDQPWPGRAAGRGSSLELDESVPVPTGTETRTAWLGSPLHWRPSSEFHGSPGSAGAGPDNRVVINELLATSTGNETDAIELLNVTGSVIDVSGWFVSDGSANFRKYRLPSGLLLPPGARWLLRESDFNAVDNPLCLEPFVLDAKGDDAYLVQADGSGALLRFVDRVEFGAGLPGVTLGRSPDGTGPMVWLAAPSLGTVNGPGRSGYEAWAGVSFSSSVSALLRSADADPDGDGFSNYAEYAFVMAPEKPDGSPLMPSMGPRDPAGFIFVYRVRSLAPDVAYLLEVSGDLVAWHPAVGEVEELSRAPQPDGSTWVTARMRYDAGIGAAARFVRAAATSR